MKILVTNHHLYNYTGSEVSILTMCKYLSRAGHEVVFYSKYLGIDLVNTLNKSTVKVIYDLNNIKEKQFDIAHVQHNISAYEVRYFFPKLPIVIWVHGLVPFLEQPPAIDLNISLFLTTNKTVFNYLIDQGVDRNKIQIFRNLVDQELFYIKNKINSSVKKALVISNKLPKKNEEIIRNVSKKLKIKTDYIGSVFNNMKPNNELVDYINKADIVFSIGLGAVESMFCGRIPILFDDNNTKFEDGIVTSQNFDVLKEHIFSGKATERIMSEQDLLLDIKKYNAKEGDLLKKKAINNYAADKQVIKLINIYQGVINDFKYKRLSYQNKKILFHINQIIKETMYHTNIVFNKK